MVATGSELAVVEAGQGPAFDADQEVRLAVVMYGGVSLAIYMYGIAEEFLHLVRATAPAGRDSNGGMPGPLAFPDPESTESVYRKLGRMLPLHDGGGDGTEGPVRTRFVVDIVSGTSAGGINGVCLAKALANGTTLAGLKNLWLTEGDIGVLVNDRLSTFDSGPGKTQTPVPGLSPDFRPRSLLNSNRMLIRLAAALKAMDAPDPAHVPPLVDELDLWVTATDLGGLELPIQLWNTTTAERRYANRYHFRFSAQEGTHDFETEDNAFLAFASRCTSSFPFAFEPMRLQHLEELSGAEDLGAIREAWSRFYADYVRAHPGFVERSFGDGGILDNKPFSYATDSLVARRASLPVDRKLIYVEPDPTALTANGTPADWNALKTVQAAVLSIPRIEGTRADIQTVLRRNRTIERARDIIAQAATDSVEQGRVAAVAREVSSEDWAAKSLAETIKSREWGASYGTYHRLKVRGLVDYLAELVVRAGGLNPESDDLLAVHYLVRAWKDSRFAEEHEAGKETENKLLTDFSLPYRWRRTNFVLQKLKELRSDDPAVVERVLKGCDLPFAELPAADDRTDVLISFRAAVTEAQDALYAADHLLSSGTGPLAAALKGRAIGRRQLATVLARPDDARMQEAARALLKEVGQAEFDGVVEVARAAIAEATAKARTLITAALGEHTSKRSPDEAKDLRSTLRYALRFYYDAFEAYDLVLYPLEYGTPIAETNPVEILRISPRDAQRPPGISASARELRGVKINHFGGFFDLEWRRHDMLWGRLNASECLIRALLPEGDPRVEPLIDEAHERIVEDFCADRTPPVPASEAAQWFRTYDPPEAPDHEQTVGVLTRAAAVVGTVVGDIVDSRQAGAAAKAAPVWAALRAAMAPGIGTPAALGRLAGLALARRAGLIAFLVWLVLLAGGIAMIAVGDATRSGGIVLTVLLLLLAAALIATLWLLVARLRRTLDARVRALVFGEVRKPPS